MLTIVLPTNPSEIEESVDDFDRLEVGQTIDGEDDLKLEVLAYYQYSPICLGDDFRIALAIVNPVGDPVPPQEEWYDFQTVYSPASCWHVYMEKGEVLRLVESPNGSLPVLGKAFYHYCTDTLFDAYPKLDRASLEKFRVSIPQRTTGLESQSYQKYVHPDAPFREIYVIELAPSKVLSAA